MWRLIFFSGFLFASWERATPAGGLNCHYRASVHTCAGNSDGAAAGSLRVSCSWTPNGVTTIFELRPLVAVNVAVAADCCLSTRAQTPWMWPLFTPFHGVTMETAPPAQKCVSAEEANHGACEGQLCSVQSQTRVQELRLCSFRKRLTNKINKPLNFASLSLSTQLSCVRCVRACVRLLLTGWKQSIMIR